MTNLPEAVAPRPSGVQMIGTDFIVTMDDVVSAFVSKYEEQLYTRKSELAAEIKRTRDDLAELDRETLSSFDSSRYAEKGFSRFNLNATPAAEPTLNWDKCRYELPITINPNDDAQRTYYRTDSMSVTVYEPIHFKKGQRHESLVKLLEQHQQDLGATLEQLKAVPRKERQVRGQIALRKIEESGYASLLEDNELLKLVQL